MRRSAISQQVVVMVTCVTRSLSPAITLKSMLQDFDSHLSAKENFVLDQRGKLGEKDKIISSQKTELERLANKSKTLEYKVGCCISYHFLITFQRHIIKITVITVKFEVSLNLCIFSRACFLA